MDNITRYKLHKVKTKWMIIGTTLCGSALASLSIGSAKADNINNENNTSISSNSSSNLNENKSNVNKDDTNKLINNSGLNNTNENEFNNSNNNNLSNNNSNSNNSAKILSADDKAENSSSKNSIVSSEATTINNNAINSSANNTAQNKPADSINNTNINNDTSTNKDTSSSSVSNDSKQINPFNNIPSSNSNSLSSITNPSDELNDSDYTTITINGKAYKTPTKSGLEKLKHLPTPDKVYTGSALNNIDNSNEKSKSNFVATTVNNDINKENKDNNSIQQNQTMNITNFQTNKAIYNPGDTVKISMSVQNNLDVDQFGTYKLNVYSPLTKEYTIASGTWKADKNGGINNIIIDWKTPDIDSQGYIINLQLFTTEGKIVGEYDNAVDVDTDWRKHPRYGALTNFSDDSQTGTNNVKNNVDVLAQDYHLNAAMLYDCYFRPQNPLPTDMNGHFTDWIGDDINEDLIKETVQEQHDKGMKSFLYNMINATTGFPGDPHTNMNDTDWQVTGSGNDRQLVSKWGVYNKDGQQEHFDMLSNNEDTEWQWYYNPESKDWQNYIGNIMKATLDYYGFDGWQGDTLGNFHDTTYEDRGNMSKAFDTDTTYGDFTNAMKQILGDKEFGMNAVNAGGEDQLAKSNADWQYMELWPDQYGGFTTYEDLAEEITKVLNESGKSPIVPAYMYNQWRKGQTANPDTMPKTFNDNALRLQWATIMANGSSPMNIADDGLLIDNEYYPGMRKDNKISMDDAAGNTTTGYLRHYYDFLTAYEDLLQDASMKRNNNYIQVWNGGGVGRGQCINHDDARANSIYAFSRSDGNIDTISLINLMNVNNINWQVNNNLDAENKNIKEQHNLWIKYYPSEQSKDIKHVFISSPDDNYQSKRIELPFVEETDPSGNKYIEFEVPDLQVWDMIYMTTDDLQPLNLSIVSDNSSSSNTNGNTSTNKPSGNINSSNTNGNTSTNKPNDDTNSSNTNGSTSTNKPSGDTDSSNTNGSTSTNKPANTNKPTTSTNDNKQNSSSNNTTNTSKPNDRNNNNQQDITKLPNEFNQDGAKLVATYPWDFDFNGKKINFNENGIQQLPDGSFIMSGNTQDPADKSNNRDQNLILSHLTKDFKPIDYMIISHGGHGSVVGALQNKDGSISIYEMINDRSQKDSNNKVVEFTYQPNKTLANNDSSIKVIGTPANSIIPYDGGATVSQDGKEIAFMPTDDIWGQANPKIYVYVLQDNKLSNKPIQVIDVNSVKPGVDKSKEVIQAYTFSNDGKKLFLTFGGAAANPHDANAMKNDPRDIVTVDISSGKATNNDLIDFANNKIYGLTGASDAELEGITESINGKGVYVCVGTWQKGINYDNSNNTNTPGKIFFIPFKQADSTTINAPINTDNKQNNNSSGATTTKPSTNNNQSSSKPSSDNKQNDSSSNTTKPTNNNDQNSNKPSSDSNSKPTTNVDNNKQNSSSSTTKPTTDNSQSSNKPSSSLPEVGSVTDTSIIKPSNNSSSNTNKDNSNKVNNDNSSKVSTSDETNNDNSNKVNNDNSSKVSTSDETNNDNSSKTNPKDNIAGDVSAGNSSAINKDETNDTKGNQAASSDTLNSKDASSKDNSTTNLGNNINSTDNKDQDALVNNSQSKDALSNNAQLQNTSKVSSSNNSQSILFKDAQSGFTKNDLSSQIDNPSNNNKDLPQSGDSKDEMIITALLTLGLIGMTKLNKRKE